MRTLALSLLLALSGSAFADEPLRWKQLGFSIAPPKASYDGGTVQVMTLMLPATEGFSPNVNIQVQPYVLSLDEYVKFSKAQAQQVGLQQVTEPKVVAGVATFEMAGSVNGSTPLRFYSRATKAKDGKHVYLVTGTALPAQWPTVGAAIQGSVDSFKLD